MAWLVYLRGAVNEEGNSSTYACAVQALPVSHWSLVFDK